MRAQKGSSLIICMLFLLLLTIMGISSMQSSTLQEKMVGNALEDNRALQAAEAALRAGEAAVQANSASYSAETDHALPAAGMTPTSGWQSVTVNGTAGGYYHVQKLSYANSVWRVTALGYGKDVNARVVLQSAYRPL